MLLYQCLMMIIMGGILDITLVVDSVLMEHGIEDTFD